MVGNRGITVLKRIEGILGLKDQKRQSLLQWWSWQLTERSDLDDLRVRARQGRRKWCRSNPGEVQERSRWEQRRGGKESFSVTDTVGPRAGMAQKECIRAHAGFVSHYEEPGSQGGVEWVKSGEEREEDLRCTVQIIGDYYDISSEKWYVSLALSLKKIPSIFEESWREPDDRVCGERMEIFQFPWRRSCDLDDRHGDERDRGVAASNF